MGKGPKSLYFKIVDLNLFREIIDEVSWKDRLKGQRGPEGMAISTGVLLEAEQEAVLTQWIEKNHRMIENRARSVLKKSSVQSPTQSRTISIRILWRCFVNSRVGNCFDCRVT